MTTDLTKFKACATRKRQHILIYKGFYKAMKIAENRLRKIIRERLLKEMQHTDGSAYSSDKVQSAFDSGVSDAREDYEPGNYHDWIAADSELMDAYDAGFDHGLENPIEEPKFKRSAEDLQRLYGDMDVGVRGKAGY